ncbi:hypothetical protein [Nocardia salmonicida]|uniref:hypothetical protein n=1 Tax=Nocardia salmonicida TaxID=53431 RepID=UPI00378DA870
MTNLWVELEVGGWVRADQIGEVGWREVYASARGARHVPAGASRTSAGWAVVARMVYTAGSWNGDGGKLGPRERLVGTFTDESAAQAAGRQLLFAMAKRSDDSAVLRLSRDGEVVYDELAAAL